MIIDTHCHLDDNRYIDDLDEVILQAKESGVGKFIIPGADIATLPRAVEIANEHKDVFFAVGVHPYDIDSYDEKILKEYIDHPKCVAVGECGLDYFRLPEDKEEIEEEKRRQKSCFISQIKLANEYSKPLIVHIREASLDSKDILQKYSKSGGVLHCYNANESLLDLSDLGFYFGIGGVLTFKNAKKLVNVLPKISKDKIVIETDSPYLTPHPYRGTRNEPKYCTLVAEKIAQLLDVTREDVETLALKNSYKLFNCTFN